MTRSQKVAGKAGVIQQARPGEKFSPQPQDGAVLGK